MDGEREMCVILEVISDDLKEPSSNPFIADLMSILEQMVVESHGTAVTHVLHVFILYFWLLGTWSDQPEIEKPSKLEVLGCLRP